MPLFFSLAISLKVSIASKSTDSLITSLILAPTECFRRVNDDTGKSPANEGDQTEKLTLSEFVKQFPLSTGLIIRILDEATRNSETNGNDEKKSESHETFDLMIKNLYQLASDQSAALNTALLSPLIAFLGDCVKNGATKAQMKACFRLFHSL